MRSKKCCFYYRRLNIPSNENNNSTNESEFETESRSKIGNIKTHANNMKARVSPERSLYPTEAFGDVVGTTTIA